MDFDSHRFDCRKATSLRSRRPGFDSR